MDNLTKHGSEVADNIAAQSGHDVLTSFQPGNVIAAGSPAEQALNTTQNLLKFGGAGEMMPSGFSSLGRARKFFILRIQERIDERTTHAEE